MLFSANSFADVFAKENIFKAHTSYAYIASFRIPTPKELQSHAILRAAKIIQEAHPMCIAAYPRPG